MNICLTHPVRSVSQLGTEKLATLEATSYNISTSVLAVQSEISAMSIPLQGIHSTLSGVETRFDSFENLLKQLLVQQPASNGSPQGVRSPVCLSNLTCQISKLIKPTLDYPYNSHRPAPRKARGPERYLRCVKWDGTTNESRCDEFRQYCLDVC